MLYNKLRKTANVSEHGKHIVDEMGALVHKLNGHNLSKIDRKVNELTGVITAATLGNRLSSIMKQVGSLATATPEFDLPIMEKHLAWGIAVKAIVDPKYRNEILKEMKKYSPIIHGRIAGAINRDMGEYMYNAMSRERFTNYNTVSSKGMRGISVADMSVMQYIWEMSKREAINSGIKKDSEAYWTYVAKKSEEVVRRSQPNYAAINRASISNANGALRVLTMFSSQPMRNVSLFVTGVSDIARGIKTGDGAMIRKGFERSFYASAVQTGLILSMMSLLKGKDDEEKYMIQEGKEWAKALIGNVVLLREVYNAYDMPFGGQDAGMIGGWLGDLGKVVKTVSTKNPTDYTESDIRNILNTARIFGWPLGGTFDTGVIAKDMYEDLNE
jgi:hypothetical protein